jgi:hypothetical protein
MNTWNDEEALPNSFLTAQSAVIYHYSTNFLHYYYYIKLTNLLYAAEHYSIGHYMLGHSIVSQHFMEPIGSIPNSQELSTCSYPEPDQSSPHHSIPPLQDPS